MNYVVRLLSGSFANNAIYSQIHPYLKVAWTVASALLKVYPRFLLCFTPLTMTGQAVSKQLEADRKIVELVKSMEKTFDFVQDATSVQEKSASE